MVAKKHQQGECIFATLGFIFPPIIANINVVTQTLANTNTRIVTKYDDSPSLHLSILG